MINGPCASKTVDETGEPFVSVKEKAEILSPTLRPGDDPSCIFVEPIAANIEVSLLCLDHTALSRGRPELGVVRQFNLIIFDQCVDGGASPFLGISSGSRRELIPCHRSKLASERRIKDDGVARRVVVLRLLAAVEAYANNECYDGRRKYGAARRCQ